MGRQGNTLTIRLGGGYFTNRHLHGQFIGKDLIAPELSTCRSIYLACAPARSSVKYHGDNWTAATPGGAVHRPVEGFVRDLKFYGAVVYLQYVSYYPMQLVLSMMS